MRTDITGAIGSVLKRTVRHACAITPFRKAVCWNVACREPLVAVTFDDGPNERWTPEVLHILERFQTPATFFLQGDRVERWPHFVQLFAGIGHEIGNHGYDHSRHDLPGQISKCDRVLRQHGVATRLFRPPNGRLRPSDLLWAVRSGYRTVMWSFDSRDSTRETGKWSGGAPCYSDVVAGDIVLMHDDNETCIQELPILLRTLSARGLQTVTVSHLCR